MFADDRDAKDAVLTRHRQHLDKAMGLAVGDRAVETVDLIDGDLVRHLLFAGLLLVQSDPRHFGLDEGRPGNHPVVRAELLERIEQRVHRRIPGLVRRHVGELVGPRDIAGRVDVRQRGL